MGREGSEAGSRASGQSGLSGLTGTSGLTVDGVVSASPAANPHRFGISSAFLFGVGRWSFDHLAPAWRSGPRITAQARRGAEDDSGYGLDDTVLADLARWRTNAEAR